MSSPPSLLTERTRLHRRAGRGRHDAATIAAILDAALVCHVGMVDDGRPLVLPTTCVRIDDQLYLHGAPASHVGRLRDAPVCIAVTIVDALVLARSGMHHSLDYRSVVVFGRARPIEDPAHKRRVLHALIDHMAPGRTAEIRPITDAELAATAVVAVPITEASAKIRSGGPVDDPDDLDARCWAGIVPVHTVLGAPEPSVDLHPEARALLDFAPRWAAGAATPRT